MADKAPRRKSSARASVSEPATTAARRAPRDRPLEARPRRARPLEAPGRRARQSPELVTDQAQAALALVEQHPETARPAATTLPAVARGVDTLTHALIALHSLVGDRMSEQAAQLMDVIDGSVAALARRDEEQIRALEDLAAQVRALGEGQRDLVSALAVLLDRTPPPPASADPSDTQVSGLRRRVGRWLLGAAESVGGVPRSGA